MPLAPAFRPLGTAEALPSALKVNQKAEWPLALTALNGFPVPNVLCIWLGESGPLAAVAEAAPAARMIAAVVNPVARILCVPS